MSSIYLDNVNIFKALSDETRLKIVDMLSCGELCACDILNLVEISQSTLSYHMKILTDCGLVVGRKDGSWVRYSLSEEKKDSFTSFSNSLVSAKEDCICHELNRDFQRCCSKNEEVVNDS